MPNSGLIRYRVLWNQERIFVTSPEALKEILVTRVYDFGMCFCYVNATTIIASAIHVYPQFDIYEGKDRTRRDGSLLSGSLNLISFLVCR